MKKPQRRDRFSSDMENARLEVRVRGVSLEGEDPFVVLEDKNTGRRIGVPIGPFEASAILLELECVATPRPLTHALLAEIFLEGGLVLDEVEIVEDRYSSIRATLRYHKGLRKFEKTVRPCDAIAIALRLDVPILVEESLLSRPEGETGPWARPKVLDLRAWRARSLQA